MPKITCLGIKMLTYYLDNQLRLICFEVTCLDTTEDLPCVGDRQPLKFQEKR